VQCPGTAVPHIWQGCAQLVEPGLRLGENGARTAPWVLPLCGSFPGHAQEVLFCSPAFSGLLRSPLLAVPCLLLLCRTGDGPSTARAGCISCCARSAPIHGPSEGVRLLGLGSLLPCHLPAPALDSSLQNSKGQQEDQRDKVHTLLMKNSG